MISISDKIHHVPVASATPFQSTVAVEVLLLSRFTAGWFIPSDGSAFIFPRR